MLKEAWVATIHYIAEIKSDRDLPNCPILLCYPSYLRWTIHEKPGQLAILTTTASGHLIQPWHGSGVIKKTKKEKIKIYPLPLFLLKNENAIPVHLDDDSNYRKDNQPFFFIDANTNITSWQQLLEILKHHLTRERKC